MIDEKSEARPAEGARLARVDSQVQATAGNSARRGTTNRNVRGSSRDRAARRAWLLAHYGDGTVTVDRIVPGCRGGRYVRGNIRPACAPCNSETGGAIRRAAP